jgi:hypothetical protein
MVKAAPAAPFVVAEPDLLSPLEREVITAPARRAAYGFLRKLRALRGRQTSPPAARRSGPARRGRCSPRGGGATKLFAGGPSGIHAAFPAGLSTGSTSANTKLASPDSGINWYVSWTPVIGTEFGPEWWVTIASVEIVL